MSWETLFRDFWWLLFPLFGMGMGVFGMIQKDRRMRDTMTLIKSYIDQGKEPPAELLKLATEGEEPGAAASQQHSGAWAFIVFAGVAAGFGTGYYLVRNEDWAFAFLIAAVAMGVMAAGALILLVTGRGKS